MDNTTIVEFSLLSNTARKPTKGSVNAAGHDLYSTCEAVILPGQRKLISTDISIKLPKFSYGRIAPRSGLAVKYCIDVHAGVIDADYRGKISVLLANMSNENFTVKVGDRIAQIIIEQIHDVTFVQTSQLDDTERGSNGFGSTGINTTDVLSQKNTIVTTDNKDDIQKKATIKDDDDDDNDDIQKITKDDMQNKSTTTTNTIADDNDSKKKSNTNATNDDPDTKTTDPKTNADNNNSSDDDYDDNSIDADDDSNSELPRKRHRPQVSSDEEKLSIFEMFGMR